MYTLKHFKLPHNFRGKSAIIVSVWWFVQATMFAWSPQFLYAWRRFLLRCFGAKIGKAVIIRPTVKVTYPWKLRIGDYSWIGDNVVLYTLGHIDIGANTIVSQKCYLCTGNHDYTKSNFPIFVKKIEIKNSCWLATDVFIAPGVIIQENVVVGARSSVFNSLDKNAMYAGNPAKFIKEIVIE